MKLVRRQVLAALGGLGFAATAGACRGTEPASRDAADPLDRLRPDGREPDLVRVGVTPTSGQATAALLDPLVAYLASAHGLRAEVATSPSYDELATAIREGRVDAAFFSPLAYVKARATMPAVAVAAAARAGSPTYIGYLVTAEDDTADGLADLQDRSVGWVDRNSTSGYLYARALLRSRGLDPDTFFSEQRFFGDHVSVIEAVAGGEVDVGATASPFVDAEPSRGAIASVKVVAKTARIPLDCAVVHDGLSRSVAKRWRRALFELASDHAASERLGHAWGMSGFVSIEPSHYDGIEAVLDEETKG